MEINSARAGFWPSARDGGEGRDGWAGVAGALGDLDSWRLFLPLCFRKAEPFLLCAQSVSLLSSLFPRRSRHAEVIHACSIGFFTERHSSLAASEVAGIVLVVWGWGRGGGDLAVGLSCDIFINRTPCATRSSDEAVVSSFRGVSSAQWAREGGEGRSGKSRPLILWFLFVDCLFHY